jgi:hypothetical protein
MRAYGEREGPGWVSNSLAGTGRSRGHRRHLLQGHPGGNPAEMSDAFGMAVAAWPRFADAPGKPRQGTAPSRRCSAAARWGVGSHGQGAKAEAAVSSLSALRRVAGGLLLGVLGSAVQALDLVGEVLGHHLPAWLHRRGQLAVLLGEAPVQDHDMRPP